MAAQTQGLDVFIARRCSFVFLQESLKAASGMDGWPFLAIAVEFVIDEMATYLVRVERIERNDCNVPDVGIGPWRK